MCGRVAGVVSSILIWAVSAGLVFAQAQPPTKKGPFPPTKAPVPPTKGPVPPMPKGPVPPMPKGPAAPVTKAPAAPNAARGPKLPEPEDHTLETDDGLKIKATYYPSAAMADKKTVVPMILVHGLEGQRGDFDSFAKYMQSLGHASIAPDLRAHGQSKIPKLTPDKLTRPALESMTKDVQACKRFLIERHIAGELNISKLCVVGAEFGATVAIRWAAMDWVPENVHPLYKTRNDVKALVLLSPQPTYKAVQYRDVLPAVQSQLSILIVVGSEDSKSSSEAKKLHKQLEPHHLATGEDTDLFLEELPTNLSGTKLLGSTLKAKDMIGVFIERRLAKQSGSEFDWKEREKR
jgi:dienelactone hydrolase